MDMDDMEMMEMSQWEDDCLRRRARGKRLDRLREICKRLYREDRMSGDEMRDMAQTLDAWIAQEDDCD